MKKIAALFAALASLALALSSCASLGVSSKGAEYFDGKKESSLAKYFGYEGEVLAEDGEDFDKMAYFSNKSVVAYMDWSNTTYTKRRRYTDLDDIQFLQMSDGCYVARGNSHYKRHWDPGTQSTIMGSNGAVTVGEGSGEVYTTHRNDNGTVSRWISQFNSNVRSYGAIGFGDDSSRFNASNIGDSYYVYAKTRNSATLGDEYATLHHWYIERVDIYLDEQTESDTQVAYSYSMM